MRLYSNRRFLKLIGLCAKRKKLLVKIVKVVVQVMNNCDMCHARGGSTESPLVLTNTARVFCFDCYYDANLPSTDPFSRVLDSGSEASSTHGNGQASAAGDVAVPSIGFFQDGIMCGMCGDQLLSFAPPLHWHTPGLEVCCACADCDGESFVCTTCHRGLRLDCCTQNDGYQCCPCVLAAHPVGQFAAETIANEHDHRIRELALRGLGRDNVIQEERSRAVDRNDRIRELVLLATGENNVSQANEIQIQDDAEEADDEMEDGGEDDEEEEAEDAENNEEQFTACNFANRDHDDDLGEQTRAFSSNARAVKRLR